MRMDADRRVIDLGPDGRRLAVLTALQEAESPLRAGQVIEVLGDGWTITRVMRALRELEASGHVSRRIHKQGDRIWVWSAVNGS